MKLGFIGGGNMAYAIAGGVLKAGLYRTEEIFVSDPNEAAHAKFAEMGVAASKENRFALQGDIVLLAVKPFILCNMLSELVKQEGEEALRNKVFASIAAGVTVREIKNALGFDAKVVRIMPNTPAMVLEGMSVLAQECAPTTEEEFSAVQKIFEAVGRAEILPENMLNAVTSVSGSSPAYVYLFIEAMADAAVRDGIARDMAYRLAAQSVLGSAKMLLETGKHPGELKDMVCSPRGTTIEAVAVLEEKGFRSAVMEAIKKCTEKANSAK